MRRDVELVCPRCEVVRRVDGRPFEHYVRDEIFLPLGMQDCWIGMPPEKFRAYDDRLGVLYMTDKQPIRPLAPYDTEAAITHCRPAANGQGPVRQLGRFYQMLLNGGELDPASRLLTPRNSSSVHDRRSASACTMKPSATRSTGAWASSSAPRDTATKPSPTASVPTLRIAPLATTGSSLRCALADPAHNLVIVIAPNGTPGEPAHDRRLRATLAAVYEDLGLGNDEIRNQNDESMTE